MTRLLPMLLTLCVVMPTSARPQSRAAGKLWTHVAFVSVTNPSGTPVLDLGPGDFEVTDGGVTRTIVRAELAKTPMRIALVIDTSDGIAPALNHLRAGLRNFIDAIPPEHEIMFVSTGRQTRVRLQPTLDRKKLKDAASGLFLDGGATPLMDGLMEIDDRFMRKAEHRWPVFIIVTGDGAESSSPANERKFKAWVDALPTRGISAHAFALKYRGGGTPEVVAAHVAESAGGHYDFLNTSNSLPEKMKELGVQVAADQKQMSTKYEVEFQTDSADVRPINVAVARGGVRLRMSYRRPFP